MLIHKKMKSENRIAILLTACVNPNGMSFTKLQNPSERLDQYLKAISFYLQNTNFSIVICENTNINFSQYFPSEVEGQRLECLSFNGNSYNKSLGKGYGEAKIIEYALLNSRLIKQSQYVLKITGRLIFRNINEITKFEWLLNGNVSFCDYSNPLKRFLSSVIFCLPTGLLSSFVEQALISVNDSKGVFFEHVLYDIVTTYKHTPLPFLFCPIVEGVRGTSNKPYKKANKNLYRLDSLYNYSCATKGKSHFVLFICSSLLYYWLISYEKFFIRKEL